MLVTGNTALNLDVSTKLSNALPLFLLVIVGLSLILLTIVFRSLLVPLKATLGFLLSIVAQRGACRSGAGRGVIPAAQVSGLRVGRSPGRSLCTAC